jgi:hypothetical protein
MFVPRKVIHQPECVKSTPRLFADDCLLYQPIRSKADSGELQADLHVDKLQKWRRKVLDPVKKVASDSIMP